MIDVKFPAIVKTCLSSLNLADLNITIPFVETLFHLIVREEYLDNKPFNNHFAEFGMDGTLFLLSYKSEILLSITSLLVYIFIFLLNRVV